MYYLNKRKKPKSKYDLNAHYTEPKQHYERTALHITSQELCRKGFLACSARSNTVVRNLIGRDYLNTCLEIAGKIDYYLTLSIPMEKFRADFEKLIPQIYLSLARVNLLHDIGSFNTQEYNEQKELLNSLRKQIIGFLHPELRQEQKAKNKPSKNNSIEPLPPEIETLYNQHALMVEQATEQYNRQVVEQLNKEQTQLKTQELVY